MSVGILGDDEFLAVFEFFLFTLVPLLHRSEIPYDAGIDFGFFQTFFRQLAHLLSAMARASTVAETFSPLASAEPVFSAGASSLS
jgi:hypothetical protein